MRLPLKISPSPIREAIVEIRFDALAPDAAVFGLVYSVMQDIYKNPEALPVTQIPAAVLAQDPNLIFQPHYRMKMDNFVLQVGPKVISLAVINDYPGWKVFKRSLDELISRIEKLKLIRTVNRIGLRYINFFDYDILQNIQLKLTINDEPLIAQQTFVRTMLNKGAFECALQVGNKVEVKSSSGAAQIGSIIDLDTSTPEGIALPLGEVPGLLNSAHDTHKETFFSILKPEFLSSLNPTYEDTVL